MVRKLKLFSCVDHDTVSPVGGASIVIAEDKKQAKLFLDRALERRGLETFQKSPYTLKHVKTDKAKAIILLDGDY